MPLNAYLGSLWTFFTSDAPFLASFWNARFKKSGSLSVYFTSRKFTVENSLAL
jgi:hypothetical protein